MKANFAKSNIVALVMALSTASTVLASNLVTGFVNYYNGTNYNDSGSNDYSGSWSVPYVTATASTPYAGLAQVAYTLAMPTATDGDGTIYYEGAGAASVRAEWSTDVLILNQSGTGGDEAVFRFNTHGEQTLDGYSAANWWVGVTSNGLDDGSGGPEIGIAAEDNAFYNQTAYLYFPFNSGVPLGFYGGAGASAYNLPPWHGLMALQLTGILLPDGASISSPSDTNWLASVPIIHPSLTASNSGTAIQLHWFALNTNNFIVETTADIYDPSAWRLLSNSGDPSPMQTGDTEFTLTYPMDAAARFFRLRRNF